jgi:hypothetical protein
VERFFICVNFFTENIVLNLTKDELGYILGWTIFLVHLGEFSQKYLVTLLANETSSEADVSHRFQ